MAADGTGATAIGSAHTVQREGPHKSSSCATVLAPGNAGAGGEAEAGPLLQHEALTPWGRAALHCGLVAAVPFLAGRRGKLFKSLEQGRHLPALGFGQVTC